MHLLAILALNDEIWTESPDDAVLLAAEVARLETDPVPEVRLADFVLVEVIVDGGVVRAHAARERPPDGRQRALEDRGHGRGRPLPEAGPVLLHEDARAEERLGPAQRLAVVQ